MLPQAILQRPRSTTKRQQALTLQGEVLSAASRWLENMENIFHLGLSNRQYWERFRNSGSIIAAPRLDPNHHDILDFSGYVAEPGNVAYGHWNEVLDTWASLPQGVVFLAEKSPSEGGLVSLFQKDESDFAVHFFTPQGSRFNEIVPDFRWESYEHAGKKSLSERVGSYSGRNV